MSIREGRCAYLSQAWRDSRLRFRAATSGSEPSLQEDDGVVVCMCVCVCERESERALKRSRRRWNDCECGHFSIYGYARGYGYIYRSRVCLCVLVHIWVVSVRGCMTAYIYGANT